MNDRETARLLAYGQYAFTRSKSNIDIKEMEVFVEAVLWHHDTLGKKQADNKYINAMQIGQEMQEKLHLPIDIDSLV